MPQKRGTSPAAREGSWVFPASSIAPHHLPQVRWEDNGRKAQGKVLPVGREKSKWPWPSRHRGQVIVSRVLRVSAFCASSAGQGKGRLFAEVPNPGTHRGQDLLGAPADTSRKAIFCVFTMNQQKM